MQYDDPHSKPEARAGDGPARQVVLVRSTYSSLMIYVTNKRQIAASVNTSLRIEGTIMLKLLQDCCGCYLGYGFAELAWWSGMVCLAPPIADFIIARFYIWYVL